MTQPAQPVSTFKPDSPHQQRPKLRPVRGFAARIGNQDALGLSDARQVSDKVVFTSPAFQAVLPLMDGQKSVDEIVNAVGRGLTRQPLEYLVGQLDDAGLLYGPTFDGMLAKMREAFDGSPVLPPATTAAFADALAEHEVRLARPEEERNNPVELSEEEKATRGTRRIGEIFNEWIAASRQNDNNPAIESLPAAIVVPHLDYQRGWINYSSVWGRLEGLSRPDRVVILGTNHFGEGTGVVGCDKGYQSPLGICEVDEALLKQLKITLGETGYTQLLAHRFDHEREHSIELQIPWIQHVFGRDDNNSFPKVFGALIHDPTVNNGESYDGKGLSMEAFVQGLRAALDTLGGRTLIVSSADLSHVGPAFGDNQPVGNVGPENPQAEQHNQAAEEFRNGVFQHDREMIELIAQGNPDQLITSMTWQGNRTRWCSIGNITAMMKLINPTSIRVYNYSAAVDEQSQSMVCSVGMVMN
jgi:AmmeMemoRadiSam system protein B